MVEQTQVVARPLPLFDIKTHDQKVQSINDKMAELTAQMNKALAELANSKPKAPTLLGSKWGSGLKFEVTTTGNTFKVYQVCAGSIVHSYPAEIAQEQLQTLAACVIKAFGEIPKEIFDSIEVTYS